MTDPAALPNAAFYPATDFNERISSVTGKCFWYPLVLSETITLFDTF